MPEKNIKQLINSHLRRHAINNGLEMPNVNSQAKKITGKPRGEMTLEELETFLEEIETHFPINNV